LITLKYSENTTPSVLMQDQTLGIVSAEIRNMRSSATNFSPEPPFRAFGYPAKQ